MTVSESALKAALEINLFLENQDLDKKSLLQNILKNYAAKYAVSEEYSGLGANFTNIYTFNKILAKKTGNIGIVLSVFINQIILRFISDFGSMNQKNRYLLKAINDGSIFSFAVSEPKFGPHPKYLKTNAMQNDDKFIINGTKTYITNAPISDYSIVVAVTKEEDKKYFSAFITDLSTKNTKLSSIENLPFFKDSPHGTIDFLDLEVKKEDILGKKDSAYKEIVLLFRKYEDILMSGPILGSFEFLLESVYKKLDLKSASKDLMYEFGLMFSTLKSLDYLSIKTCDELETNGSITDYIHLFFREEIKTLVERFSNICKKFEIDLDKREHELLTDLQSSGKIAFKATYNKLLKISKKIEF